MESWLCGLCVLCEGEEREGDEEGRAGSRYIPSALILSGLVLCCAVWLCCATPSFPFPPIQAGGSGVLYPPCFSVPHTWTPCHADLVPTDRPWASSAVIRPIPLHGMNMNGSGPPVRLTNTQQGVSTSTPRLGASHAPVQLHLQTETRVPAVPD